MKHTLTSRITELEGMKFKVMLEKDKCGQLGRYRKLVDRITEIDKLIELNKELIKGLK